MPVIIHHRYKLLKKCGSGGAGEVYKALDLRLGRHVALKRARAADPDGVKKAARLVREAQHLARVDHPNVVAVYDILEGERSTAIIMELVRGMPLRRLLMKRPMPEKDFLALFRQLLAALAAVHEAGLVHRDVNPKNVVIASGGVLKLTDFGLAGEVKDPNLRFGGTVGFMAPEALRRGGPIGFGVDIYGAGFLAYQALLGLREFKRLYGAANPREWVRWVLSREKFRTLGALGAPVSAGLSAIVERMIEKDPALRYARVAAVEGDLEALAGAAAAPPAPPAAPAAPADTPVPASAPAPTPTPTPAAGPSVMAGVRRLFPSLLSGSRAEQAPPS